jgi:hypothetical protein
MKKLIIPAGLLAMAAFIGIAYAWDCVRLANDARERVELADQEVQKHEQRLVKTLEGFADRTPEVDAALAKYSETWDIEPRHEAYDELVTAFQKTMAGEIDADNPLNRKFMDDVSGAINRRQVALKAFDAKWSAYQEFLDSGRGRVAQRFSEQKFVAE